MFSLVKLHYFKIKLIQDKLNTYGSFTTTHVHIHTYIHTWSAYPHWGFLWLSSTPPSTPSKNLNIKIYKTIILFLVLYRHERLSLTLWEYIALRCLKTEWWGEYLDLRERKRQEAVEDCIMGSFIVFMLHQILLGWSN